jgi:hypothetical protein
MILFKPAIFVVLSIVVNLMKSSAGATKLLLAVN